MLTPQGYRIIKFRIKVTKKKEYIAVMVVSVNSNEIEYPVPDFLDEQPHMTLFNKNTESYARDVIDKYKEFLKNKEYYIEVPLE